MFSRIFAKDMFLDVIERFPDFAVFLNGTNWDILYKQSIWELVWLIVLTLKC